MTNEQYVQQIVSQAPPLTEERRAFLSQIFSEGGVKSEEVSNAHGGVRAA